MRPETFFRLLLLSALIIAEPWPTRAHEVRPALLQIKQVGADEYAVTWKVPRKDDLLPAIDPVFPPWFIIKEKDGGVEAGSGALFTMKAVTSRDIHGMVVTVNGLPQSLIDVLLYVEFIDGEKYSMLLQPAKNRATIPFGSSYAGTILTYFQLGVEHILIGFDHLLFVLALLLLSGGTRRLIATITAFTVAHSITLSLSVLGFVGLPGPPVEAVIALSIVFLSVELVNHYKGEQVLSARRPWIVAFIFGLLHGFGFAGALSDIGLPHKGVPLALAFFNVGVEVGQLLFIGAVLSLIAVIRRIGFTRRSLNTMIVPYAIGSVAAFWFIERLYAMIFQSA